MEQEAPREPDAAEEQVDQVIEQGRLFRRDVGCWHSERGAWVAVRDARSTCRGRPTESWADDRQGAVVRNGVPELETR